MTPGFVHTTAASRVVFGAGAVETLPAEVDRLGLRRLLVVSTPEQAGSAASITAPLGERVAELHPHAVVHVPAHVADRAVEHARRIGADGCVAIGGGSATGLAKAVTLRTGLPVVAVPTTYAGSEMTPVWGLTDGGGKRTGRDPRVLPVTVVYDPLLTLGLPAAVSLTSGINAVAHAVEALYAPDASPVTSLLAAEAVRSLVMALPGVVADGTDVGARSDALRGAWLAGTVLGSTTMSLHHQLCHVLGGAFDLPHASTHTAVLPHVLALLLPAHEGARSTLERALDTDDPAARLFHLARDLGAEMSLASLGLPADGVAAVIDRVLDAPYPTPAPVSRAELHHLLGAALAGTSPG